MIFETLTSLITTAVALLGSSIALIEYRRQGKNRRFGSLLGLRKDFEELALRNDLLTKLVAGDTAIGEMSFVTRAEILGRLEIVAAGLQGLPP